MSFPARATDEFAAWWRGLDEVDANRVAAAIELLEERGPALGRPMVGRIEMAAAAKSARRSYADIGWTLSELRIGSIRVLFTFDANRTPVLLLGADKGQAGWKQWYAAAIPQAVCLFDEYVAEMAAEGLL
jgi:hypothetical protein